MWKIRGSNNFWMSCENIKGCETDTLSPKYAPGRHSWHEIKSVNKKSVIIRVGKSIPTS